MITNSLIAVERLIVDHGRGCQSQHIERTDQVDIDHRAKSLQRQHVALVDQTSWSRYPSTVDRDSESAELE